MSHTIIHLIHATVCVCLLFFTRCHSWFSSHLQHTFSKRHAEVFNRNKTKTRGSSINGGWFASCHARHEIYNNLKTTSITSCVRSVRMREQLGNRSYREIPRRLFGYVRRLQVRKVSGLGLILERFTNTRLNFTRVNTFTFTHDLSNICNHLLDVNFSETQKTLPNYREVRSPYSESQARKDKKRDNWKIKEMIILQQ